MAIDKSKGETGIRENTAQKSGEPNAQNSELNPKTHPSGARIEKLMTDSNSGERETRDRDHVVNTETGNEKGESGEVLRPSERYTPPEDPAEGSRDDVPSSPHRDTPETRES